MVSYLLHPLHCCIDTCAVQFIRFSDIIYPLLTPGWGGPMRPSPGLACCASITQGALLQNDWLLLLLLVLDKMPCCWPLDQSEREGWYSQDFRVASAGQFTFEANFGQPGEGGWIFLSFLLPQSQHGLWLYMWSRKWQDNLFPHSKASLHVFFSVCLLLLFPVLSALGLHFTKEAPVPLILASGSL